MRSCLIFMILFYFCNHFILNRRTIWPRAHLRFVLRRKHNRPLCGYFDQSDAISNEKYVFDRCEKLRPFHEGRPFAELFEKANKKLDNCKTRCPYLGRWMKNSFENDSKRTKLKMVSVLFEEILLCSVVFGVYWKKAMEKTIFVGQASACQIFKFTLDMDRVFPDDWVVIELTRPN